jgi:NADH dehydrogenase [ubiquinone] 1 alpha subcomplex assembly factor 5
MTARALCHDLSPRAQSAQIASSPIGCANGRPQTVHQGGPKKVMPSQQRAHRVCGSPTIVPQPRQRGGNTTSTTARPRRRKPLAERIVEAGIAAHIILDAAFPSIVTRGKAQMTDARARPPALFDRRAWRLHRDRAARPRPVDFLHTAVAERLLDRLDAIARPFPTALDLGDCRKTLYRALSRRPGTERVVVADPSVAWLGPESGLRVAADPQLVPFAEGSVDLAVGVLLLHWVDDLPGALVQLRRTLEPDGLLLMAMLGGKTLAELRAVLIEAELVEEGGAGPHVSPMAELADVAALLQRTGFAMPVADAETIVVTYPDMPALLHDLRGMGETNALALRRRTPLRRATLGRAAALYRERYGSVNGRIGATFELLWLTGWAPAPGQPKPLRPGSATHRLAAALGTPEHFLGEHPARQPGADVEPREKLSEGHDHVSDRSRATSGWSAGGIG